MYLPLAALVVGAVLGVEAWLRRSVREVAARRLAAASLAGACLVTLAAATIRRNAVYHDDIRLWQATAAQQPWNSRAFTNLSMAAVGHCRTCVYQAVVV